MGLMKIKTIKGFKKQIPLVIITIMLMILMVPFTGCLSEGNGVESQYCDLDDQRPIIDPDFINDSETYTSTSIELPTSYILEQVNL